MRNILTIAGRESDGLVFATPVATVFIVIFLVHCKGDVDLQFWAITSTAWPGRPQTRSSLFVSWVFLLLVPAITMRLWAEERRLGTTSNCL